MTANWYDDHKNLAAVARNMTEEDDAGQVVYMLEKPWKFTDVWLATQALDAAESVVERAAWGGAT